MFIESSKLNFKFPMAVKVSIVALVCVLSSVYGRNIFLDAETNAVKRTQHTYEHEWLEKRCRREDDKICARRDQSWCESLNVQKQCPKLCGLCGVPFTGVCPTEYKFGCCWDGTESMSPDKSDCPECFERYPHICNYPALRRDCDLQSNTQITRQLCPKTCGACHDFGN